MNIKSSDSTDSDLYYVEQSLDEQSLLRNNTPDKLNCTELSEAHEREKITISSVTSPKPQMVAINSDSDDQTFLYRFGRQDPIIPPASAI